MKKKKIVAEYPIEICNNLGNLALYRFPDLNSYLEINKIKYWDRCGHVEIEMKFPQSNVSHIKLKNLGTSVITYKADRINKKSYYYLNIKEGKALLTKIPSLYLFEPYHHYYNLPEENKDEILKMERSYDLDDSRRLMSEDMQVLEFVNESNSFSNTYTTENLKSEYVNGSDNFSDVYNIENIKDKLEECTISESKLKEANTFSCRANLQEKTISDFEFQKENNFFCNNVKIEKFIIRARIVNMSVLIEMCKNKDLVKNILFKMTNKLSGRFVLKNNYYEDCLHEKRTKLLNLFIHNGETKISNTFFLKDEDWMVDEIADKIGTNYVLKGFYEDADFNIDEIRISNKMKIDELLKKFVMLGVREINAHTGIEEDLINLNFKEFNTEYIHLANNAFTLANDNPLINQILIILSNNKSVSLEEIQDLCKNENFEYDENFIVSELKKICNQRAKKFFIKNIK